MNGKNKIQSALVFLAGMLLASACKKIEEAPAKIGQGLPFTGGATKKLAELLDSLPDCTLYNAIFKRSDLQPYMDSLNAGKASAPYTLFVPSDKAFGAAGFTMDRIATMPAPDLDTLVRYLALQGNFATHTDGAPGSTFYPLMYPDPGLTRTITPTFFSDYAPYFYALSLGFSGNSLLLNGKKVSGDATPILATNGVIYRIDSLVQKPFFEMYQVLNSDTSYSFYMAALRRSDSLYVQKGIIGAASYNLQFNDTAALMLNGSNTIIGSNPFTILLVPDNDAFRKAGFQSIDDIDAFIDQSALAYADPYTSILTNMDSILQYHQLWYGFYNTTVSATPGEGGSYLYTPDLANYPSIAIVHYADSYISGLINNVVFQNNGGQLTAHRADAPSGRGATLLSPSDITTLNGVIHRVDNLLLPTP